MNQDEIRTLDEAIAKIRQAKERLQKEDTDIAIAKIQKLDWLKNQKVSIYHNSMAGAGLPSFILFALPTIALPLFVDHVYLMGGGGIGFENSIIYSERGYGWLNGPQIVTSNIDMLTEFVRANNLKLSSSDLKYAKLLVERAI